ATCQRGGAGELRTLGQEAGDLAPHDLAARGDLGDQVDEQALVVLAQVFSVDLDVQDVVDRQRALLLDDVIQVHRTHSAEREVRRRVELLKDGVAEHGRMRYCQVM